MPGLSLRTIATGQEGSAGEAQTSPQARSKCRNSHSRVPLRSSGKGPLRHGADKERHCLQKQSTVSFCRTVKVAEFHHYSRSMVGHQAQHTPTSAAMSSRSFTSTFSCAQTQHARPGEPGKCSPKREGPYRLTIAECPRPLAQRTKGIHHLLPRSCRGLPF